MIAIGASTGGTEALKEVLTKMPLHIPGVLVVQHMPAQFTHAFAERLNKICSIEVREAQDGDSVLNGQALIAPGNFHMSLKRSGAKYFVNIEDGPMVHHQRPAVDVLFPLCGAVCGVQCHRGHSYRDGSRWSPGDPAPEGIGGKTIAQDEASCVVFGMPKEAIRLGAIDRVVPIDRIPQVGHPPPQQFVR